MSDTKFFNENFHSKWKFNVLFTIAGLTLPTNFQKCSALEMEVAVSEYYEGGSAFPNKAPGRGKVSDITFERGSCSDDSLWNWFTQVVAVTTGGKTTRPYPLFKASVLINQLNLDNSSAKTWRVEGAWPIKFVAGDFDNTSDDRTIQQLVLACDYFELSSSSKSKVTL